MKKKSMEKIKNEITNKLRANDGDEDDEGLENEWKKTHTHNNLTMRID